MRTLLSGGLLLSLPSDTPRVEAALLGRFALHPVLGGHCGDPGLFRPLQLARYSNDRC